MKTILFLSSFFCAICHSETTIAAITTDKGSICLIYYDVRPEKFHFLLYKIGTGNQDLPVQVFDKELLITVKGQIIRLPSDGGFVIEFNTNNSELTVACPKLDWSKIEKMIAAPKLQIDEFRRALK